MRVRRAVFRVVTVVSVSAWFSTAEAQWRVVWRTDEMTDIRQAIFSIPATTLTRTTIGRLGRTALVFRCSSGALDDAYVSLNAYTPETEVTLRFDGGTPFTEEWEAGTDETALFAADPGALLDSLLTHRLFRFRFTPHRSAPQTATFTIPRFTSVGATMSKMCGIRPVARADSIRRIRVAVADSISRSVGIIKLVPKGGLDTLPADTGVIYLRRYIREVRDNRGRVIRDYRVGADISMSSEGRRMSLDSDSIWLDPGVSEVTIVVNGVAADSVLRFRRER